jgi:hypothetical protein
MIEASCQQIHRVLLSFVVGEAAVLEKTDHEFGWLFVALGAEVGLGEQQLQLVVGLYRENVLYCLFEFSLVVEEVGVELLEGFVGGRILEVGLGELIGKGDLEGWDDEALLVVEVVRVVLEQLFGELVDLIMILPLDGVSERPYPVLSALHKIL